MSATDAPQLRPARDDDGDGLADLIAACFAEYPGCLFDRALEFPELDAIATHFADQDGVIWLAEQRGRIVGSLGARPTADGGLELLKVYVDARWRGTGLALRLLGQAECLASQRAAHQLELWSDTRFERAHRFYAKHGFRPTGERRFLADISDSWEARFVRPLNAAAGSRRASP
ncbi:MAG: N-acetyltransferase [Geminicoccaceae bacterium]|nr:MAG: N-acetyltransferase [Geminicoccaceae bacterium]